MAFRGTGPQGSLVREDMATWSRSLHRYAPKNLFKITMVPYKTIAMSIFLFAMGTYFLIRGFNSIGQEPTYNDSGERMGPAAYEIIILGLLLFIPGSYHTVVAMLAYAN